jgi:hypothetical protein
MPVQTQWNEEKRKKNINKKKTIMRLVDMKIIEMNGKKRIIK